MRRTRRLTELVPGAFTAKRPSSDVYVPVVVPTTVTAAPESGVVPSSATTRPVIRRCCASATDADNTATTPNMNVRIFTAPPIEQLERLLAGVGRPRPDAPCGGRS